MVRCLLQICFGYRGTLQDQVGVLFSYRDTQGRQLERSAQISTVFSSSDRSVRSSQC